MAVVPTTERGWFDYLANKDEMVDYDYANSVDIDDISARWRTAKWLMSQESQSKATDTPIFYNWEGELGDRIFTVDGAHTTSETTITLDDTSGLIAGMVLAAQSSATAAGRYIRVASVVNATDITITSVTTAAGISDNQELKVVGTAQTENAASGIDDSFVYPSRVTNRVQIIQRAVEWTKQELAMKLQAETALKQKHTQGRAEYEKDLDGVILSSTLAVDTTNKFQTSNGIIPVILGASGATKVNAGAAISYANVTAAVEGMMQYITTTDIVALCGTSAIRGMADLGTSTSTYQSRPGDNELGFSGQHFAVGEFKVHLVFERMMKELGGEYNNYAILIDPKGWMVRHMPGLKFEWKKNFQDTKSSQIIRSQWESHVGVGYTHAKRNALIHSLS